MSNVIQFPVPLADSYTRDGVCPKCHRHNGYMNVGAEHWYHCALHKLKWSVGSNLYSGWREETEADWKRNFEYLTGLVEVEPAYPSAEDKSA